MLMHLRQVIKHRALPHIGVPRKGDDPVIGQGFDDVKFFLLLRGIICLQFLVHSLLLI